MQQGKNISVEISKFEVENSVNEYHVMIHVENPMLTFAEQASAVSDAFADAASELGAKPVFKRYFLSDSATQTDALFAIAEKQSECAVSVVEQPPLNGTKVALWAYLQTDVEVESAGNGMFVAKHGDFKHIWSGYNYSDGKDSEEQTRTLLIDYVAQLQKLVEAQPDNIKIWERMARVAYLMEDYGAMSDACEKALLLDKDNPEVSFLYARACLGHGEEVNAVAMLTKTIAIKPDFLDAYLLRGQTLLKMGDTKGAAEDADYLVEKAPDNEDALLLKAKVEEALGHHEDAITYYNKVINANPFCIDAFKGRGAIRLAQGDAKGAEEDMKSVLELDPKKAAEVNGEYTGEGTEDIQQKTEQAYRNNNPFGLG